MSKRKQMDTIKSKTTFATDSLIAATSRVDAITKNAATKATIEFKFFLVYLTPPNSSVPKILVFSKTAKTIVKTRRNGRITSYTPKSAKNWMVSRNVEAMDAFKGVRFIKIVALLEV